MNKVLVFDMDGTIADFYGVEGWLEYLNKEENQCANQKQQYVGVEHQTVARTYHPWHIAP